MQHKLNYQYARCKLGLKVLHIPHIVHFFLRGAFSPPAEVKDPLWVPHEKVFILYKIDRSFYFEMYFNRCSI